MSQAGRRLVEDHEDLHRLLEQLTTALNEKDEDVARSTLDLFWARLAVHIRAEHLRLFPAVLEAVQRTDRAFGDSVSLAEAQSVVARLRDDHNFFMHELASAISTTAGLEQISASVKRVEERLVGHNELEETRIYSWIGSILNAAEQAQLAQQIDEELLKHPPRFAADTWLG